jgi:hypothetical protein
MRSSPLAGQLGRFVSIGIEIAVIVAANVLATIVRFAVLRATIAPDRAGAAQTAAEGFEGTAS